MVRSAVLVVGVSPVAIGCGSRQTSAPPLQGCDRAEGGCQECQSIHYHQARVQWPELSELMPASGRSKAANRPGDEA